jgi:hypothetical protein
MLFEVLDEEKQIYDFTKQQTLRKEDLVDLKAFAMLPHGDQPVNLEIKLVENPPAEFVVKATITLFNKLTFEYI